MMRESGDVTQLLLAWGQGDETTRDELIPLIYDALRRWEPSTTCRRSRRVGRRSTGGVICSAWASFFQIYAALAFYYEHPLEFDSEIQRRWQAVNEVAALEANSPLQKRLRELRKQNLRN